MGALRCRHVYRPNFHLPQQNRRIGQAEIHVQANKSQVTKHSPKPSWSPSIKFKLSDPLGTAAVPVFRDEHHVSPDDTTLGGGGDLLEGAQVLAAVEDEVVVLLVICS